jgi:hypothetical protein
VKPFIQTAIRKVHNLYFADHSPRCQRWSFPTDTLDEPGNGQVRCLSGDALRDFEWMDIKNLSIESLVAQNIRQSRKLGVPSVCEWHLPIQRRTTMSQRAFRIGRCVVFTFFGCASVAFSLNPGKQIDEYVHDSWNSRHDFPGEAVYQILQTRDGYPTHIRRARINVGPEERLR